MTGPRTSPAAPDWDAIARYLAGEASASEAEQVRQWLDAHPNDARAIATLDAAVGRYAPRTVVDVEAALHRVKTRGTRRAPRWPYAIAGLAAAAAIAWFAILNRPDTDVVVEGTPTEGRHTTNVGERETVTLPDGSRFTLAPSTTLSVVGREVALDGEAMFSIADGAGPYTVRAGGVRIRDIGTAFSVRAYRNEPVRVVVASGSVEVSSRTATVVLDSADVGVGLPGGAVTRTADAVTDDDVAWMQGRLVFRNATMSELRADLQRWYGVELHVADSSLQRRHFTGSFAGEPVSRIANVLALALGARAELRGDTILIRR